MLRQDPVYAQCTTVCKACMLCGKLWQPMIDAFGRKGALGNCMHAHLSAEVSNAGHFATEHPQRMKALARCCIRYCGILRNPAPTCFQEQGCCWSLEGSSQGKGWTLICFVSWLILQGWKGEVSHSERQTITCWFGSFQNLLPICAGTASTPTSSRRCQENGGRRLDSPSC